MTWLLATCALMLFIWAFTEAFVWPVVPDVALASLAFLAPEGAWLFVGAAVGGSMAGGAAAMVAYRMGWRWPLPLVSDAMRARVEHWLERGPIGLVNQPLTAVPYKAFVVEGARRRLAVAPWVMWTGVFRGARMASVAVLAWIGSVLVGHVFAENAAQASVIILAIGLVVFVIGWRLAWRLWSGRESASPTRTPQGPTRTMQP